MTINANDVPKENGETLIVAFSKTVKAQLEKEAKKAKENEPYQFDKATETLEIAEGAVQWQILQK